MNENHSQLDELIRRELGDDVPPDIESQLNLQIVGFFEEHPETGYSTIPDFRFLQPFLEWFSKPAVSFAVTAVLFACMITLSTSLHISKQKNALATTIDTIQLMANVFSAIESTQTFIIEQKIARDENTYTSKIRWVDDFSRIDFPDREVWVMHDGTTEIYHPGKQSTAITPLHETAALFATPEEIVNQLMGKWTVARTDPAQFHEPLNLRIENLREGYSIQLWIDPTTHLPIRLQSTAAARPGGGMIPWQSIQMDFIWDQAIDPKAIQPVNPIKGDTP